MKNDFIDAIKAERKENGSGWNSVFTNTGKLLLIMAGTVLLTALFRSYGISSPSLILVYVLSVVVISYVTPTYLYGIVAALVSTLAYDFLITEPRLMFSFDTGSPITLVTMLAVTFIISTLTIQSKAQALLAIERERRAQLMREVTQELLAARDVMTIVKLTNAYLVSNLKRPVVFYTGDPLKPGFEAFSDSPDGRDTEIFDSDSERKQVHRIFKNGASEAEHPFDDTAYDVIYVPIESRGKMLGVIGVACKDMELAPAGRTFIHMIAGQVTFALDLQILADEQNNIAVAAAKEKIRSPLLRSICHDLRTPLTSIMWASSTILEQRDMDRPTVESLVKDIKDNAGWLIRMVENILIITRISGDNMKVQKTMEAAEEVVAGAAENVQNRFPDYFIHVHIPDELLMVPMDATLISQVIINLLENAVKNSEENSLILLDLEKKGDYAQFDINDSGKGIAEGVLENLFEVHSPEKEEAVDASRGVGIGLNICKTIVQAHGGHIEGHNRQNGGASFTFRLPLYAEEVADGR